MKWIEQTKLLKSYKPISMKTTYRYKHDDDGNNVNLKARCSLGENIMLPSIHYDPETSNTATYTANKAAIRLIFSIAESTAHPVRHFDIPSYFRAEKYDYHNPVYVLQLPLFNGELLHPNKSIAWLHKNLYGSRTSSHTYIKGLQAQLSKHTRISMRTDVSTSKAVSMVPKSSESQPTTFS